MACFGEFGEGIKSEAVGLDFETRCTLRSGLAQPNCIEDRSKRQAHEHSCHSWPLFPQSGSRGRGTMRNIRVVEGDGVYAEVEAGLVNTRQRGVPA